MRAVAICAVLTASVLEAAPLTNFYGESMPVRLRMAAEGHWYRTPSPSGGGEGERTYQSTLYSSLSFKPLAAALLHAGFRSRTTQVAGAGESLPEWVALNLAGSLEVLPGFLYGSFGVHLPFHAGQASLADSAAYAHAFNGYSPLDEALALPLSSVHAGVHARRGLGVYEVVGSGVLHFPGSYEFYPGLRRRSAAYHTWRLSLGGGAGPVRRELELRWAAFLPESDNQRDAHREGDLYQARYSSTRPHRVGVLQWSVGASLKRTDLNRQFKSSSGAGFLGEAERNDNLQRLFAELAWMRSRVDGRSLQVRWSPQLLYAAGAGTGFESGLGASFWASVGAVQAVRITPTVRTAWFAGEPYYGGGLKLEYSFSSGSARLAPERPRKPNP